MSTSNAGFAYFHCHCALEWWWHHTSTTPEQQNILYFIPLGFGMTPAPHWYLHHTGTAPIHQNTFIFYSDGLWNDTSTTLVFTPHRHRTGTTKYFYILMGFGMRPASHQYWHHTRTAPVPWNIALLYCCYNLVPNQYCTCTHIRHLCIHHKR